MSAAEAIRQEIKEYIEEADEKTLNLVHSVLEAEAKAEGDDWWDTLPDEVKADVEAALAEADRGELIPHKEVQKEYHKWLSK